MAQLLVAHLGHLTTFEDDRPGRYMGRRVQQLRHGVHERRLPAAGLPDDCEELPAIEVEVDVVDGVHGPAAVAYATDRPPTLSSGPGVVSLVRAGPAVAPAAPAVVVAELCGRLAICQAPLWAPSGPLQVGASPVPPVPCSRRAVLTRRDRRWDSRRTGRSAGLEISSKA